jgi:hypothetical protein
VYLIRQFGMQDSLPIYLMDLKYVRGYLGDYDGIRQLLQQTVDLAHSQNRHWDESVVLFYLGEIHLLFEQLIAVSEALERTLSLNERSQADPQLIGRAQYGLARLAVFRGEHREAHQWGEQSLTTFTQIGHYLAGQVQA